MDGSTFGRVLGFGAAIVVAGIAIFKFNEEEQRRRDAKAAPWLTQLEEVEKRLQLLSVKVGRMLKTAHTFSREDGSFYGLSLAELGGLQERVGRIQKAGEDIRRVQVKVKRLHESIHVVSEDLKTLGARIFDDTKPKQAAKQHAEAPVQQLTADVAKQQQKMDVPKHLAPRFSEYLKTISARGYFGSLSPASEEYKQRFIKARAKFLEKFDVPEQPAPVAVGAASVGGGAAATPSNPLEAPSSPVPAPSSPGCSLDLSAPTSPEVPTSPSPTMLEPVTLTPTTGVFIG